MNDPVDLIRSALPGIAWPAVPGPETAALLALQLQLDHSQWLAPEPLRELQFHQLEALLRHAHETVPYYRERWRDLHDSARPLTPEAFSRLPLLTRSELQAHFDDLKSTGVPAAHGAVSESRTSGSTGRPVRVLKTLLNEFMWQTLTLRDHLWHRRDLGGKLAAIRQNVPDAEGEGWGPATDRVFRTGRSATLPVSADVETQLRWLEGQQPDYLLSYPSNLVELARASLARAVRLPRLREVRTMGETLVDGLHELCQQAWGARVTDSYSSNEVGYIALQCPDGRHYHVQSENVLIEVLDEKGGACAPGMTGRVIVTDLHNFALPLVRYEIGDYAEVGRPCPCGRGLPVLSRIVGRVRNMLVLATGERYWPSFNTRGIENIASVLQHQFVQKEYDMIEARLVTAGPLTGQQEEGLRQHFLSRLPAGFRLRFVYCGEIPRSAGGKFEYFISEVAAPNR